jgi:hypothetical protein
VALAWLVSQQPAAAQPTGADPVEELREALKSSALEPGIRDRRLREIVPAIQDLGDLRRALGLREWRDQDPEEKWAAVDRRHRATIALLFTESVRAVFAQGDETAQLAVLRLLADLSTSGDGRANLELARQFTAELVGLSERKSGRARIAAIRVLASVDPDPTVATAAMGRMLSAVDVSDRIAAVDALWGWMRFVSNLAIQNADAAGVQTSRAHLAAVGRAVVLLAGRALKDPDPQVRRRGLQAIGQAADSLCRIVAATRLPQELEAMDEVQQQIDREREELLPLIAALGTQGPALMRALSDPDAQVATLARRSLEDMTNPQLQLLERANRIAQGRAGSVPTSGNPFILTSSSPASALVQGLNGMAQNLASALGDKDVQARRAVIEVLENLGRAATPVADSLVAALADSDPFVRWAAARALGKIAPVAAAAAAPALARLLHDRDLDLRLAAATALERYGPPAKTAMGALIESVKSTEPTLRLASIRAIAAIGGPEALQAIPVLASSLTDSEPRVRQLAATVLGKFGNAAKGAEPSLRLALEDKDPEVQKAAGEALLKINRPGRKPANR